MVKQFIKERLGTIIFLVIIAIFVIWGSLSINKARENAITYAEDYEAPEGNADLTQEGKYVSIASSDKLELYYNEVKGAIQIKNLESGYLWKSIADNEVYDLEDMNAQWASYLQSPITISYNDLKKRDSGVKKLYAAKDCKWLESETIENGVAVTYGFLTPGIYLTVEYSLEDDQLVVRIPRDKIVEESKFALTTIEVMPFMGASQNTIDGYIFYPDGSGAISTYEKADTRSANVKSASYYTYTNKTVNFQNLWYSDAYSRYTASMPVFGIKNGENAMFAAFTQGAENTGVVAYPSGYVVDLNHIGFEVYTRNVFNVDMYSISTGTETSVTGGMVQRVDKQLIDEDREARFFFLSGQEASYSGMANVYREYLLENGLLHDAISEEDGMALSLQLLMGTSKDGMIFEEFVPMTTFEQSEEILQRLNDKGVTDTHVVLESWIEDYYEYKNWGPVSQLGGKGGLKSLNNYIKEDQANNNVYLTNQFTFASSITSGLSEDTDVAYDGLNIEISAETMDGITYYLLNPSISYKWNQKFLERMEKFDVLGIAYEELGEIAYPDYNGNAAYTKTETVEKYRELLADTKNTNRKIAINGANQYTYTYADFMYDLSEESYGLSITDHAVPFVQMVLSGLIPYSTEGAGNLAYDLQIQKLKWIEYGAIPNFYLTYESALNLADTPYDALFSSTYDDWEDTVVDTYIEFKNNLSCVYGRQMVSHELLTDKLCKLTYDNGVVIYINYDEETVSAEGNKIPAREYVVVGGGK